MKRMICLILAVSMVFTLAACGGPKQENAPAPAEAPQPAATDTSDPTEAAGEYHWIAEGYFTDENEHLLSITWMDDVDEPGWYVAVVLGQDWIEDAWSGMLPQAGDALKGELLSSGEKDPITVTVTETGAVGIRVVVEGGETYTFMPYEMPDATIFVQISTEGFGNIAYAEGEGAPEVDPEYPLQWAQINLAEPATHTILAWPQVGNTFVKWTKNGEDFSTEPQITVLLDESADFVAVFEEDPDWQNPVMNFIGNYQCDRAHALVECFGNEEALITIDWGGSAWEQVRWTIFGRLDLDTMTIEYSDCTKSIITYDENGEIKSQEPEYEDGTGTIVFGEGLTFTWHEDQAEDREDMVFEWLPVEEDASEQLANPWRDITEAEAKELCPNSLAVPENARNVLWSALDSAADPSGVPGALVQVFFDLDGSSFTAREQVTGDPEADISGMYYDWTCQTDENLRNWADSVCHTYRHIGEDGYADLCTWYDAESGTSYSVSIIADDLDGFDLLAIAEALHG